MSIYILVNGEAKTVPAGHTLAALVRDMALEGQRIAVEVNQEIVPRSDYASHTLNPDDRIEVVTAIGGG